MIHGRWMLGSGINGAPGTGQPGGPGGILWGNGGDGGSGAPGQVGGRGVSSSVLEVLQRDGLSTGHGIKVILATSAALLLPAGVAVLGFTRAKTRSATPKVTGQEQVSPS